MNTNELKEWILQNNVEKRVKQDFQNCFKNYKISSPDEFEYYFGEFDDKLLEIGVKKVCLEINDWPEAEEEFIVAFAPIIYKEEELGMYKLFFNLYGEAVDDTLIMYSEYYINRD